MNNAAETSFDLDDEEGSAEHAAVLGSDGGPVRGVSANAPGTDLAVLEDEFDEEWLDEELSDEELAALGEEDFEAAFDDDFSDENVVTGDLDDFDDLDDFELLEAPSDVISAGAPKDDVSEPSGAFQSDPIGDDLFDIGEEEPSMASDADIPPTVSETAASSQNHDHQGEPEPVEADPYDDSSTLDFDVDDEFSIDDELKASAESEASKGNAAIVTVGGNEVRRKENASVASPEEMDPTASVEPEFADDEDDSFAEMDEEDSGHHRPVPRISIHAFCETSRNSSLLERAAVDRRLAKAHFTMHMGGIEKAIDLYQTNSTPNLVILETVHGGVQLIQQLGLLAEVCDPSTKVVIIGRVNDIRLYRELIRQGISEYIVRPKSPLQVIKTISELYVDPSAPPIGKTVAFVGTRGGVGSSTLAHNVGWSIAEDFKSDTVILDLDLPFGTTALDFDHEPTSGLMEALSSPERLDDVLLERLLQKHTDHLSLFTAPNMLDRDYDIDDDAYETVIDIVRATAPTVVIDVPHNWTGWSKKILQTADEIVIVATPDFASFRNMKYLMEVIGSSRPNDSKPYFVYNQFDPKMSAVPVEYFVENIDLEPSLILGWEPHLFNQAATNAAPIMEVSPKSKVAQGINELSGKILGRQETLALPSRFSLTSLFKRK